MLIISTMMLPAAVTLIPQYQMWNKLHLLGTIAPMVIPAWFGGSAYFTFMLRQFFQTIPKELDEAAEIDGCNKLQTYFHVVFPLVAPGLMATAVYSFLVGWNEFMFALVLTGNRTRTMPVAIASLETKQGIQIAELCAATIVSILPVVLLSSFIKKYLINGLTFGSVK